VTLFDEDGGLQAGPTAEHAARLVSLGVRAVLVNGTTGEAAALSDTERAAVVAAVRQSCPDVPVLAGASGEWWRPAADRVVAAVAAGADAVLVAPPRSGPFDDYYARVAEAAAGVPVLAYHYPGSAGGEVPVEALPRLPVTGVKDSTGSPERLAAQLDLGWSGAVYTGSAALLGYAGWLGAAGAIVAAANLVPEQCVAAWGGDADAQREVLRAERAAGQRFPGGLKEAMAKRFGTATGSRVGS
jgi:dihydrodipicolinate synthase/N-acetylneuraminate lyase